MLRIKYIFSLICWTVGAFLWIGLAQHLSAEERSITDWQPAPRIVGGEPATQLFPWMVSIQDVGVSDSFCGGTVIHEQFILTAGHCVTADLSSRPLVGFSGANSLADRDSADITPISYIIRHPQFDESILLNDIALLRLGSPLSVQPVTIADPELVDNLTENSDLLLLGWGATDFVDSDYLYPEVLHQAYIAPVDREMCANSYAEFGFKVTSEMLCASQPPIDACNGDSGGPLLIDNAGTLQQVGLVSFGSDRCNPEQIPGVYTDVSRYEAFIEQSLKGPVISADFGYAGLNRTIIVEAVLSSWSPFELAGIISQEDPITEIDYSDCTIEVALNQSCTVQITVSSAQAGFVDASIRFHAVSDDEGAATEIMVSVTGWVLNAFPDAESVVQTTAGDIEWFTGGDQSWQVTSDRAYGGHSSLVSGDVELAEASILVAYGQGPAFMRFFSQLQGRANSAELRVKLNRGSQSAGTQLISTVGDWRASDFEMLAESEYQLVWIFSRKNLTSAAVAYVDNFEFSTEPLPAISTGGGGGGVLSPAFMLFIVVLGSVVRLQAHREWKRLNS